MYNKTVMEKELSLSKDVVFTTGYEGKDIDTFLTHLLNHNIKQLIDVREIPISRKKGFSKSSLRERLAGHNIDYVHMRELGSPTPLRKKLYKDNDFDYFFRRYDEHLERCRKDLEELYTLINEKLSCLLCFEREASNCHRSAVADKVSRINGRPLQINHI